MVHVDAKKVGRDPDGGGWRSHGRGSEQAKAVGRRKKRTERGGYVCLHSAVDGFSRLAYTEALPDEKAVTAVAFRHRARAWFAAHGITQTERVVTDNGSCYRADAFARSLLGARQQRITPYTPRHNGKVERYHRILAEEFLSARAWTSEDQRCEALAVCAVWNIRYNRHRPHSGADGQTPATRLREGVTNVLASYSQLDDHGDHQHPSLSGVAGVSDGHRPTSRLRMSSMDSRRTSRRASPSRTAATGGRPTRL